MEELIISGLKIKNIYSKNNIKEAFSKDLLDFSNLLYKNLKFCEIINIINYNII